MQSAATLATLLAHAAGPDALFVDAPENGGQGGGNRLPPLIRAGDADGVLELAAAEGIEAAAGSLLQLRRFVEKCRPERVLVSCYPHRIDSGLLGCVPRGWLNIHPSLLPEYRGINPIFWQLRDGHAFIGVTLHRMDRELDQGPVIDQYSFGLADFPDYFEICRRVGRCGTQLFLEYLENQRKGWSAETVQDPGTGSRQGPPRQEDFMIGPDWSVRRVVRFVRGVRYLGMPFLDTPAGRELVQDAQVPVRGRLTRALPGERLIHCYDGNVVLRVFGEERR